MLPDYGVNSPSMVSVASAKIPNSASTSPIGLIIVVPLPPQPVRKTRLFTVHHTVRDPHGQAREAEEREALVGGRPDLDRSEQVDGVVEECAVRVAVVLGVVLGVGGRLGRAQAEGVRPRAKIERDLEPDDRALARVERRKRRADLCRARAEDVVAKTVEDADAGPGLGDGADGLNDHGDQDGLADGEGERVPAGAAGDACGEYSQPAVPVAVPAAIADDVVGDDLVDMCARLCVHRGDVRLDGGRAVAA